MKKAKVTTSNIDNQYGAKELQQYQKKAVLKGFAITLFIFLFIGIMVPKLVNIESINLDNFISIPKPTIYYVFPKEKIADKIPANSNINSTKTTKAGSGLKAGNPNPVKNEIIDKIEFADVKLAGVSFADGRQGDKTIIGTSTQPTTIVVMHQPTTTTTNYPQADDFIVYEKEAQVNLSNLSRLIEYPQIAKAASIQGNVTVQVLISADGNPIKSKILSSDNAVLEQAAIDAIMKIKYEPAIQNGSNVPSWLIIPITFRLKN